jgi:hypothetical protein
MRQNNTRDMIYDAHLDRKLYVYYVLIMLQILFLSES